MISQPRYKLLKDEESKQTKDRWMISYADLMTLLLALFIVLYAASDNKRAQKVVESLNSHTTSGDGILPDSDSAFDKKILLENSVLIEKTIIKQTKEGLVISLSEAGFFAPGEANISQDTEIVINALVEDLKNSQAKIRVEGHTDSTPISNARYPSNWELSTARASAVLAKLIELGISPKRLSAAGYGGFQPIAKNSTSEGRAKNRRVDVVILNR